MKNTKEVTRRTVKYTDLQQALEDAERLAAADAPTTGNWSKGQIFEHLAIVLSTAVDGAASKAPFFSGLLGKFIVKPMILKGGMTPGFQLPKWAAGELIAPDDTPMDTALDHLRQSTERFLATDNPHPHPFFGPMSKQEWTTLMVHHAELHMGFIDEAA